MPLLKEPGIGMMLYEWSDGKIGATAMPIGTRDTRAHARRVTA